MEKRLSMNYEYKSQFGQDKYIIENIFDKMTYGYFIDIGAGDGVTISNTYVMEKNLKWDGICIEPSSISFPSLIKNRMCKCDDTLVYNRSGTEKYYEIKNTGYFNEYFSSVYKPSEHFNDYNLLDKKCDTLYNILNRLKSATMIHYLSIDTEGSEYDILKKFFEDEYITDTKTWKRRILSISIEHNFNESYRSEIKDLMNFYLYDKVNELTVDDIYVHRLYSHLAK